MSVINIHRIIDVQSIITPVAQTRRDFRNVLFVYKGTTVGGERTNNYTSASDVVTAYGSNTQPAIAATQFFSGGFNGLKPLGFWIANFNSSTETWANVIAELLGDPRYYYICLSNDFTVAENKQLAAAIEAATTINYVGSYLDTEGQAASASLAADLTSMGALFKSNSYGRDFVHFDNASASADYKHVVDLSYFATVGFTQDRPLGSLAFKNFSGISPTVFASPDIYAGNLIDKNINFYSAFGEIGRNIAYKGVMPNGTDISVIVGADWLDYNMTYAIYDLLVTLPKLSYTQEDFNKLYSVMDTVCQQAVAFGLLAPGVDPDTGINYTNGYQIFIPNPKDISSSDKSQGILTGIYVIAIIAGVVVKISITNLLKY